MLPSDPSPLRTSLLQSGYIIIPSFLSPSSLPALRSASAHAISLARSGHWPYIRTLPKQFPPWPSSPTNGIWGVQHLLHPDMPGRDLFAASYFSSAVASTATSLLAVSQDELVMELYNLLCRPDTDFELRWHRDDIGAEATAGEELVRLQQPAWHAQWNLALVDGDESLRVVPGSHRRARTEEERRARPYEALEGEVVVRLEAGDAVFYNNNLLHRGVYEAERERMTLHGSVGVERGGGERARNVLQHGVGEWVERCEWEGLEEEGVRRRAREMWRKLVEMGKGKGDVGFSHHD